MAIKGFRLFSHDVTQVFLKIKPNLARQVFIRPKKKERQVLGLKENELFELVQPLYGLCDAGDYWGTSKELHLINDLGLSQPCGDAQMYYWK